MLIKLIMGYSHNFSVVYECMASILFWINAVHDSITLVL